MSHLGLRLSGIEAVPSSAVIEIGLTGGIGAGKSTVAAGLVQRGAVLIDADEIVRDLQRPGQPVFEAMVQRWGETVVAENGSLDRGAVATIVFGDEDELKALNDIVHPAVAEAMVAQRKALVDQEATGSSAVAVLDIPLLVRADGKSLADQYADLAGIVVVDVDPELAIERLVKHRGFSEDDARKRIANQATREARRAVADFLIDNSAGLEDLHAEIARCWEWIETLAVTPPS